MTREPGPSWSSTPRTRTPSFRRLRGRWRSSALHGIQTGRRGEIRHRCDEFN
ncbi:hypothetical protein GBA52_011957 [Prunus armeniaca]|nr:hypothetical protein GBA52_011957 [Prunus armeniaca]